MPSSKLLDQKFIHLISSSLSRFERKKEGLYSFRCPYCGDSKKDKSKTRGFFFEVQNGFVFKCHNCNRSTTVKTFLKDHFPGMFPEYVKDFLKDETKASILFESPSSKKMISQKSIEQDFYRDFSKFFPISPNSKPWEFLMNRKIPEERILELKFNAEPTRFWKDSRILIPFRDFDGTLIGIQGRSFSKTPALRYLSQKFDMNKSMIFNADKLNLNETVYCTEGAFDSMFLPNACAAAGSNLKKFLKIPMKARVFVFDNEPRGKEIVDLMREIIEAGENIVIWNPENVNGQKDINAMILSGKTKEEILDEIQKRTFSGLVAKARLAEWLGT